jgi:hypothetical protein
LHWSPDKPLPTRPTLGSSGTARNPAARARLYRALATPTGPGAGSAHPSAPFADGDLRIPALQSGSFGPGPAGEDARGRFSGGGGREPRSLLASRTWLVPAIWPLGPRRTASRVNPSAAQAGPAAASAPVTAAARPTAGHPAARYRGARRPRTPPPRWSRSPAWRPSAGAWRSRASGRDRSAGRRTVCETRVGVGVSV